MAPKTDNTYKLRNQEFLQEYAQREGVKIMFNGVMYREITKGKGPKRNGPKNRGLNRGSIPATGFFRKGYNSSKNKAAKEIERLILSAIAKQARKQ